MLLHHKKVAIIGGGPVGLTMARLLQQQGIAVKVYERDESATARIWGGTLDLHRGTGQQAMQAAGLLQRYYELARPMGIIFANHDGKVLKIKDLAPGEEHDNPEISRNALRAMLLESLEPETVTWNSKCTGLDTEGGKWRLLFENTPAATADFVICANGGRSRVRHYVTDTEAQETGTFIIQGDVPQPEINCPNFFEWCNGHRLMAAYEGNLLVANPYNGDSMSYGIIFSDVKGNTIPAGKDQIAAFLNERFVGWNKVYRELFLATEFFVALPTRVLPLSSWKPNRPLPVTLIGDAAHLMPPFAGQGVNIGLKDALILAQNLTGDNFSSIEAAISNYEEQMFSYAAAAQGESRENELAMRQPSFSFNQFIN